MIKNSIGIFLVALGLLLSCVDHNTFNPKTQLKEDKAKISSFLAGYDPLAQSTKEGIWYTIDTVGLGVYPVVSDSVEIEYEIFDIPDLNLLYTSPRVGTKTFKLTLLSSVLAGLQAGLPRFPTESYGRVYVPSGLAFGTTGNPYSNVLPNTNLLFKIKVVKTKGTHFAMDTASVVNYLNTIGGSLLEQKIVVIKDPTGIRYWYDTLYADSLKPNLVDHQMINVSYIGKVLNAVHAFDSAANINVDLTKQITAWKIILPQITKGSTVTMYVESGYGYGSLLQPPDTTITVNSNLIYRVTINKVY